ncbi:MAG: enoyl-CoA hydratase/isomerase family protein [Planctomycetota bacterium]
MSSDTIQVKVTEPVATIVLNRPDCCNALTRSMILALREAVGDLHQERRVRAVVLTGAGRGFCGGRDLREILGDPERADPPGPSAWGDEAGEYRDLLLDLLQLPKPVIAAVNGAAAACGAGLVLASDLVVASPTAAFGMPDARRGLVAGVAGPLLAYRLGAGAAARVLLSAQMLDADEALRLGVYHEIVAEDLLWARAVEMGRTCAEAAPEAVLLTKRLLLETAGESLATQLTSGAIATATGRTTEAAREGVRAFVEKRPPEWP